MSRPKLPPDRKRRNRTFSLLDSGFEVVQKLAIRLKMSQGELIEYLVHKEASKVLKETEVRK